MLPRMENHHECQVPHIGVIALESCCGPECHVFTRGDFGCVLHEPREERGS